MKDYLNFQKEVHGIRTVLGGGPYEELVQWLKEHAKEGASANRYR